MAKQNYLIHSDFEKGRLTRRDFLRYATLYGVEAKLQEMGCVLQKSIIKSQAEFTMEIATTFELQHLISKEVAAAVSDGAFPLVLAGNCNSTVGALSGLSYL